MQSTGTANLQMKSIIRANAMQTAPQCLIHHPPMTSFRKSSPNAKIKQQTDHDHNFKKILHNFRKLITMAHVLTTSKIF